MNIHRKRDRIFDIFGTVIKSILLGFLLTFIVGFIIGFKPVIVVGESMTPAIYQGDVIIVYKVPEDELKAGDIVTFSKIAGGFYTTHRIVRIEDEKIYTKGDPNDSEDSGYLLYSDIVGKVIYILPFTGNIIEFFLFIPNLINFLIIVVSFPFLVSYFKRYKASYLFFDNLLY